MKHTLSLANTRPGRLAAYAILLLAALACAARALPLQANDEAALRALAEKYFAAYARKEADALLKMWSEKSPNLAQGRRAMQQVFAAHDRLEVRAMNVVAVNVEGEKATVRSTVEMAAVEVRTGAPAGPPFGRMNRVLRFVREGMDWKVWRDASAEEELAAEVIAARTEEERQQILGREKGLMEAELSRAVNDQGRRYADQGNYAQALAAFQLAMKFAERADFKPGQIRALINVGYTQNLQGDYTQALASLRQARTLASAIDHQELIGTSLVNMFVAHYRQGDYAQALELAQQALAIGERLKNRVMVSNLLNNIGGLYTAQGNPLQALEYFKRSLVIKQELGDKVTAARTLNNMGESYAQLGDYARAEEYFRQSLAFKEETGDRAGMATTNMNIGVAKQEQGQHAGALEAFKKALALSEEVGSKLATVEVLYNIALVEKLQGEFKKSLETNERAQALARQMGDRESVWSLLALAGEARRALNQPAEAERAFTESVQIIEALRAQAAGGEQDQQRFFENKTSPYREMVELLVSQNRTSEALSYAERARARVLLDVLHSGRVNVTKAMRPEEQAEEKRLTSELAALNAQVAREESREPADAARLAELRTRLQKVRLEREAFETGLYAAHPELKIQRGEPRPVSLEDARDLLPDARTALLEFVVTNDKALLFVLTKGAGAAVNLRAYTLAASAKDLQAKAVRFRKALAERNFDFGAEARELYEQLLAPAAKQLEGKTALVIVPDGSLWGLPFQALRTGGEKFLVEDFAVSYAPSLTVLREMMKSRPKPAHNSGGDSVLLAFGNPNIGEQVTARAASLNLSTRLFPLPEAEKQVNQLAQLYGAARSRVYTGAAATEDRAKTEAARFSVLQFATHAVLNDSNPMYSHVVLSRPAGGAEDGLLEAWEMMNLNIRADMVVLSACETARGRVGAGEGVIGMTWALFVAGSPTTVVSQWKVESASTTELMLEFHKNLRAGKEPLSKAQALRQASLKLLRGAEYRHPFYWAGFVIVGDSR
ncbi:MAG TPA: CHAT domain-containing protein [Pyrinomonadaceae bacterium]|nr:CHAT domain-containing protein [Pyrinomonadaceae bacterium]